MTESSRKLTKAGAQLTSSPKTGIYREENPNDRYTDTCINTLSEVQEKAEEETGSDLLQATDKQRGVEDDSEYKYIEFDQDDRGLIVHFDTLLSDKCADCSSGSFISQASDNAKDVLTNMSARIDSSCELHTFVHFYEGDGTKVMRSSLFNENSKLNKSNNDPSEHSDGGGDNALVDEDKYENADDSDAIDNDEKKDYDNDYNDDAAEHDSKIITDDTLGDNSDGETDHRCCRWFLFAEFRKKRRQPPGDSRLLHDAQATLKHATGDDKTINDDNPNDNGDADAVNVYDDADIVKYDNLSDNGECDVDIVSDDDDTVKDDNLDDNGGGDDDNDTDDTVKDGNMGDNSEDDSFFIAADSNAVSDDTLDDNGNGDADNVAAAHDTVIDDDVGNDGDGDKDYGCCSWSLFPVFRKKQRQPPRLSYSPREADNTSDSGAKKDVDRKSRFNWIMQSLGLRQGPKDISKTW